MAQQRAVDGDHFGGLFLSKLHPRWEKRPLTKVNSVFRDAFHRFSVAGRIRAGQECERSNVDAEDWLKNVAELANHAQNSPVAAHHYHEIGCGSQLRDRLIRFFSGNCGSFFFQQYRDGKTVELFDYGIDQVTDAWFSRVRD